MAQHDNREGPADGSLCAGVKGPPRRGPLVPRLHAAAANQRAWSPPAAANLQTRGPGVNRKGIRRRGAQGRRLPGPLQASGLFPTTAGAQSGSLEPPACVEVRAPRRSRPAPSGPGIPLRPRPRRRCPRVGTVGGSAGRRSARTPSPGPQPADWRRRGKVTATSQVARARGLRPRRPPPRGRAASLRGRHGAEPLRAQENAPRNLSPSPF